MATVTRYDFDLYGAAKRVPFAPLFWHSNNGLPIWDTPIGIQEVAPHKFIDEVFRVTCEHHCFCDIYSFKLAEIAVYGIVEAPVPKQMKMAYSCWYIDTQ